MLSDSTQNQNLPSPKTREGWLYPDSTKQDALKLYLLTGNLRQVSASMNIPYYTLKEWKGSRWWSELAADIRTEGHLALSAKMQKIADKAMSETMDRLENGDPVVNQKTGEVIRKPVSMRDAHQVAVSFQDRALKLADSPENEAQQLAVHDRLAQLADAFAKMAGKTRKLEVIDVPFQESTASDTPEVGYFPQETPSSPEKALVIDVQATSGSVGGPDSVPCIPQGSLGNPG